MKMIIQRVNKACVRVEEEIVGSIEAGLLVFVGISDTDNKTVADKLIRKLIGLRIFEDEQGKTNLSLSDTNGSLLLVSQFTLYANCKKGNRPSFVDAGKPDVAKELFDYIYDCCKKQVPVVNKGIFGADMKVSLENDGPFTIILDSEHL